MFSGLHPSLKSNDKPNNQTLATSRIYYSVYALFNFEHILISRLSMPSIGKSNSKKSSLIIGKRQNATNKIKSVSYVIKIMFRLISRSASKQFCQICLSLQPNIISIYSIHSHMEI